MNQLVSALSDELLALQSEADPLGATMLGVAGFDDRLADVSREAEESLVERLTDVAGRATVLGDSKLSAEDSVTVAVVSEQARSTADRIRARTVEYAITDMNYVGPAARLLMLMPTAALNDAASAEAYLTRLRQIPGHLAAVAERHRVGVTAGRVPVRRLVDAAVRHLDRYLAEPNADPLLRPEPKASPAGFAADRERILADIVRPAFAEYRAVLTDELARHGRPDGRPGLCWLPGGGETYVTLSRVHTTTDRTPEELHQTGLEMAAQLREEYAELGSRVFGTTEQSEIFRRLTEDPAMRWQDEEELLAYARSAVERAEAAAPLWFERRPGHSCQVQPVPAAEASGAPQAYYVQPPLDLSRPGVYFANTHACRGRSRFLSEATAFHEAVPGHHFQLTVGLELSGLPPLRRLADINAFIEGWALYSERLADEMGLYSDDVARLGMIALDSMRAARLVVDTGLHAKGWSRARAVTYLRENTPLSMHEIDGEVDRYVAYPGQALSYMVGRLEIQRIRASAEQRLGERFDIRAFHDVVLCNGPLPLNVLSKVVADWDGTLGAA
ncbi:DUF885 domain-containing protein [Streptomyces sp. NPDC057271]|uniref:DUF885 domain-containing protein n=1 Tax=unclassified Streptomyces TaxID=2593676 RepID=UPI0036290988